MRAFLGLMVAVFLCSSATGAELEYLKLDAKGQLVVSGPFSVVVPAPKGFRSAEPMHRVERFLKETLTSSIGGFFSDTGFIVIEVETTDAPAGTLTYEGRLPTVEIAGSVFHTRSACVEFSPEELKSNRGRLIDYVAHQNHQQLPAAYVRQLLVTTDDGTGDGAILYGQHLNDCDQATEKFVAGFDQRFKAFMHTIQEANPEHDH